MPFLSLAILKQLYKSSFLIMDINISFQVPITKEIFPSKKHVAIIGHCFGNETRLDQCKHYVDKNGVKCKSNKAVAVACQSGEPLIIIRHIYVIAEIANFPIIMFIILQSLIRIVPSTRDWVKGRHSEAALLKNWHLIIPFLGPK